MSTDPSIRASLITTIALAACLLAAATPLRAENEPLLRLERAPAHAQQWMPFGHPATFGETELTELLGSLQFRERGFRGRSNAQAVFSADELAGLVPLLAESFRRAGSTEQVRFVSFGRGSGALSRVLKTEAVGFVDSQGRLNLAFAGIQEFAGPDIDYLDFLQLSDRDALRMERSLVELDNSSGTWSVQADRPLWARVDPASSRAPAPVAARPALKPPASAPESASRTAPATDAVHQGAHESAHAVQQRAQSDIRQRLEFLKGLYEDGLISESEYEQLRREALQRLD